MFSGGTPPQRTGTPRRVNSRRVSRVAPSSVPVSGQTTPSRNDSPQPQSQSLNHSTVTPRALSMGLNSLNSGTPVVSGAMNSSRRKKSFAVGATANFAEFEGMEVEEVKKDDGGDKVLVRDDNFVLMERKNLPTEVEQIILFADTYSDPFRASLDSTTGYAYLVSRDYCLVWNWSRHSSSTTTYIFPLPTTTSLPSAISAFSPLAFACLVPSSTHQSTREPGLLIATTTGEIRYWESLSMALSGVDRWKPANANLVEGELVRNITLLSLTRYLLSTSQSRILCITLSSVGGRTELSVGAFEKSLGWAGSVWGAVFGSKVADPRAGILALALSSPTVDGERVGYAVTDKDVQVWKLPNRGEGGERLAVEHDLLQGVIEALANEEGRIIENEESAINAGKVEIVDAVVALNGSLAVLISHITDFTPTGTLSYAIVSLNVGTTPNSITSGGVRHLDYEPHPDPRPLSSPKLSLASDEIAFVIFVDTLVMLSLSQSSLEETFPLRTNANRFLGISTFSPSSTTQSLTLLTSTASLLTLKVAPTQGLVFDKPGSEGFETRKLKSKIEQAIFFEGDDADNPLAFKLLRDYKGDLIAAAEAVSTEILSSSAANMPMILDLKVQLNDRSARAKALINFVNSNGLLGKLSQTSRRQLSIDAEQLAAVSALWQHQNARLGDPNSLLTNAITTYMSDAGEVFAEDILRTFYRTKVRSIGIILEHVNKLAKSLLISNSGAEARTSILQEANHINILVFNAVNRHRKETATLYGLDSNLILQSPWSSQPEILESLQWHFEATDELLRQRIREMGTVLDEEQANYAGKNRGVTSDRIEQQALQADLKKHMTLLADFTFAAYEERLTHLRSNLNKETGTSPESRALSERYLTLRSHFIHTLVSIDKVTHAYDLAERYEDYRSLVELCNDSKHGSESRTRFFMQKYEEKFAFALYNFFVEKGLLRALLNQDELYRPLLTKFLDGTDNSHISWLNDFAIARYDHAANTLIDEAASQKDWGQQKLLLSLAKLSEIAQVTKQTIRSEEVLRATENVDDRLDLVRTQEILYDLFRRNLSITQTRLSLDNQGEALTSTMAPSLHNRPAFAQLYSKFSKQLLQGQVLSVEDLVDLMSLKQNIGESKGDFGSAVELLLRAKTMPEERKQIALESVWRRIYLHDNWEGLRSATTFNDEELSDALRSTALYSSLVALAGEKLPIELYLEPQRSLSTATSESIAARLPDLAPEDINSILIDYELENQMISEALGQFGLLDFTAEVFRLFKLRNQDEDLENRMG